MLSPEEKIKRLQAIIDVLVKYQNDEDTTNYLHDEDITYDESVNTFFVCHIYRDLFESDEQIFIDIPELKYITNGDDYIWLSNNDADLEVTYPEVRELKILLLLLAIEIIKDPLYEIK